MPSLETSFFDRLKPAEILRRFFNMLFFILFSTGLILNIKPAERSVATQE